MAPPSFAFKMMRKAVLTLAVEHPALRSLINPRQTLAIEYSASPLNAASDPFQTGPAPGAALAECPLTLAGRRGDTRGGHLTDLVTPRFTVFCFVDGGEPDPSLVALEQRLRQAGLPFDLVVLDKQQPESHERRGGADPTGRLFAMYGARAGTVYLVRPDGHVLGRWHDARATDLEAALTHALQARIPSDLQEHA